MRKCIKRRPELYVITGPQEIQDRIIIQRGKIFDTEDEVYFPAEEINISNWENGETKDFLEKYKSIFQ